MATNEELVEDLEEFYGDFLQAVVGIDKECVQAHGKAVIGIIGQLMSQMEE